jgi:ssRNA-specific RNase YbeY (16S rRNA maturation enzyme)
MTLVLHGYLHLLGYDHERDDGRMLRLQDRLERRLFEVRR